MKGRPFGKEVKRNDGKEKESRSPKDFRETCHKIIKPGRIESSGGTFVEKGVNEKEDI